MILCQKCIVLKRNEINEAKVYFPFISPGFYPWEVQRFLLAFQNGPITVLTSRDKTLALNLQ